MSNIIQMKELFSKAYKSALTSDEGHLLLSCMKNDPTLVHYIGLIPQRLPELVKKNLIVTADILSRLVNSEKFLGYLTALRSMDMSVNSMKVVNQLISVHKLPMEFVHTYVGKCFTFCRDEPNQNRHARLVCSFLQSLIRRKIIIGQTLKDWHMDIEKFCLEHKKIIGADALLKLAKSRDSDGKPDCDV